MTVPREMVFKMLATSSGGVDMNAAGSSSAAITFLLRPDTSRGPLDVNRINLTLVGEAPFLPGGFGGADAPLTNGIKVQITDSTGGLVLDFLDGRTITQNHEWALLAGVDSAVAPGTSAKSDAHLPIRWTLLKSGARLHLGIGHELRFTIQDDLTSTDMLTTFLAKAQGFYH